MHLSEPRHNKKTTVAYPELRLIPFFLHFGGNWQLALTIKNCHQNANFKVCSDGRFSLGVNLFHGISRVDDPAIAFQ